MASKKLRAARANGSALGNCFAITPSNSEYTVLGAFRQEPLDVVTLIATRARVALPTARLFAELHGIGGGL